MYVRDIDDLALAILRNLGIRAQSSGASTVSISDVRKACSANLPSEFKREFSSLVLDGSGRDQ